jgi:hypothetical protein
MWPQIPLTKSSDSHNTILRSLGETPNLDEWNVKTDHNEAIPAHV